VTYAVSSFRTNGNGATTQTLFALVNDGPATVTVNSLSVVMDRDTTTAQTMIAAQVQAWRTEQEVTGGTALTVVKATTGWVDVPAGVSVLGATASDGGTLTPITPAAPDAGVAGQVLTSRMQTTATTGGQVLTDVLRPLALGVAPFIVRPGESLVVGVAAAATASNPTTQRYFVNVMFEAQAAGLAPVLLAPADGALASGTAFSWDFQSDNNDTQGRFAFRRSGVPWEIETMSNPSFYVGGQEGTPLALFFKPDGLSMFVVGTTADTVFQYTLTTPWDVSTASYASKSFSVASQETNPRGLFFKPDGLVMYTVGSTSDTVFQYTLTTAWDVSTASYASKSFSVAKQETVPSAVFFKPDGLTFFMFGEAADVVFTYSLSTAWDVSTAVAPPAFSVISQETGPNALFFKPDGSSMFVVGATADTVLQYDLSAPWNINTASYASKSFSVNPQDANPQGLFFKPDGLTLFVVGLSTDAVYQYTLTTAWDVSTASYASKSFSVLEQEASPRGLFFKPDGLTLFVIGSSTDTVYQYTLTTAWDVSTASYAAKSFSVNPQDGTPTEVFFKPDGLVMYVMGLGARVVFQYDLPPDQWWDGSDWTDIETFITSPDETLTLPSEAWG
jgi:6-phosphogluconolactonase (cycloisomerase 2 family)